MSLKSKSDLMNANEGKKDRVFRYTLQNGVYGSLVMRYAPDGWREGEVTFERDEVYKGVLRTYSTNELIFVKDARDFLRNVYENQGISAECTMLVEYFKRDTRTYETYFTGKIDFSTYRIEETGVKCQLIDNSFIEKWRSRDEIDLDVLDNTGIDGGTSPAIPIQTVYIRPKTLYEESRFDGTGTADHGVYSGGVIGETILQPGFRRNFNALDSAVEVVGNLTDPLSDSSAIILNASRALNLAISGSCSVTVNWAGASFPASVIASVYLYRNGSGSWVPAIVPLATQSIPNYHVAPYDFTFSLSWNGAGFLVAEGESIAILIKFNVPATEVSVNSLDLYMYDRMYIEGSQPVAVPVYEAFWKLAAKMTGSPLPIYSLFFGRTDSVNIYASDGELQFLTRGGLILDNPDDNGKLSLSFRKLFQSFDAIFRLGASVERISGFDRIRIENEDYFYDSEVVLDLSSRIRADAIIKEVIPTRHYNEVQAGYEKFSYEAYDGLREYNTKNIFSTAINNLKNVLNIVSPYRADTSGIDKLRLAKKSGEPGSVEGQDDIFIIDAIKQDSGQRVAREGDTSDGFSLVTGGLGVKDWLNLRLTPKRNLLRWGSAIRAGLCRNLSSYIRYQSTDRYSQLVTQLTGELVPVSEAADQLVKNLNVQRYYAEKYVVEEFPFYPADMAAITANPRGMIKFAEDKYGWILSLKTSNVSGKASVEALRVNTFVVTPT